MISLKLCSWLQAFLYCLAWRIMCQIMPKEQKSVELIQYMEKLRPLSHRLCHDLTFWYNFYTISEKFSHLAHLTLDLEHQPFFLILSKVPRASSMCHDSPSLWRRQSFLSISWEYFTPRYHQAALDFSFTFSNLVSNPERWYLAPLTNEAAVFPAFCSFSFVVLAKEIDWWSRWPEKSQLKVLLISFSEFRLSLCFSLILGAFQHLQIYFNWII